MIYKSLYFYDTDVFESILRSRSNKLDNSILRIYLPYIAFTDSEIVSVLNNLTCEKIAVLPYINKCNARNDFVCNFSAVCRTADGFLIENIGDLPFLSKLFSSNCNTDSNNTDSFSTDCASAVRGNNKILCGDYSLNVYNAESAAYWAASGLKSITISPEPEAAEQLNLANAVCKIAGNQNGGRTITLPEIIASGKVIVMRSEHCFITDNPKYHCGRCGKNGTAGYSLTDNAGNTFPLIGLPLDCQNLVLSACNVKIDEEYVKKHISGDCILRYNILNDHR